MDHKEALLKHCHTRISVTSKAITSTSEARSIMLLPSEIRVMIFTVLVVFNGPIMLLPDFDMSAFCALLATSKTIRGEVLELLFDKNTFLIKDAVRSDRFIRKLPARFMSRIKWLEIDIPVSTIQFNERYGPLMRAVRLMKTLKGCSITLRQCRCGNRLSGFVGGQTVVANRTQCSGGGCIHLSLGDFCGLLKLSQACQLTVRIAGPGNEIGVIGVKAMESIRKGHGRNGTDWSRFLALKDKIGGDL